MPHLLFLHSYTCTYLLQKKLPHKTINNFTSDWNDGTLVAALVDAMAPGLCPENEDMDPQNALHNATHAMKLAEDWLDVPQVSSRYSYVSLLVCYFTHRLYIMKALNPRHLHSKDYGLCVCVVTLGNSLYARDIQAY